MAAVAPTYLSGKDGSVTVDAVALPITKWEGDHAVGTFDATNSTTSGAGFPERTIETLNGSFEMVWKVTSGAPAFNVGEVYAIELITKTTQKYACNALITGVKVTTDVKGGILVAVNFMSQGAITDIS